MGIASRVLMNAAPVSASWADDIMASMILQRRGWIRLAVVLVMLHQQGIFAYR